MKTEELPLQSFNVLELKPSNIAAIEPTSSELKKASGPQASAS